MTRYRIEIPAHGYATLMDSTVGEGMHSSIGPWQEANLLYVEQSGLESRLLQKGSESLVIYDIGLGMATNVLASLHLFNRIESRRPLHVISFETDISGLEFALDQKDHFPFLQDKEALLRELLAHKTWEGSSPSGAPIRWDLKIGDYRQEMGDCLPPEVIYYDLYSQKSLPDMWGRACFDLLYQKAKPRLQRGLGTQILTYTCSTPARTAMLLAGFYVGYGVSTGKKIETTVASTLLEELHRPLGNEWVQRWRRSRSPLPLDCLAQGLPEVEKFLTQRLENSCQPGGFKAPLSPLCLR